MTSKTITVPYRGKRDYVHGTTLFELLLDGCPKQASSLDFRVNRRVDSNGLRLLPSVPPGEAAQHPCSMTWESAGTLHTAAVTEAGEPDAGIRNAYDEAGIVAQARFEDDRPAVSLAVASSTPFIDAVVALNKELLLRQVPVPAGSQYVFTRLELKEPPPPECRLDLEFWRTVGGLHFITRIIVNDVRFGMVHFSRWNRS